MKKLLAVIIAVLMLLTACEATPAEYTDGEANTQNSNNKNPHNSSKGEENFEASESGLEEETSQNENKEHSAIKGPESSGSTEKDNYSEQSNKDENMTNYVIRANSSDDAGEAFLWRHSVNKQEKGECQVLIFKSKEELRAFVSDLKNYYQIETGRDHLKGFLESYDEEFFKENVLVIGHILANSGSIRYSVKDTLAKNGKYIVNMNVEAPEVGTMDMADWFVVIEEPSSRIEDCIYFSFSVKSAATSSEVEWKDK